MKFTTIFLVFFLSLTTSAFASDLESNARANGVVDYLMLKAGFKAIQVYKVSEDELKVKCIFNLANLATYESLIRLDNPLFKRYVVGNNSGTSWQALNTYYGEKRDWIKSKLVITLLEHLEKIN